MRSRPPRPRRAAALALLLLAASAYSNAPGIDTDLMQSIEDANKNLASNLALADAAAADADAAELDALFVTVETFYAGKPEAPDAAQLAGKSRELAQRIRAAIGARDFGEAQNAATELSRTCKTCHNFYKKS